MLDDYGALIAREQVFVLEDETGLIGLTVFFAEPGGFILDNVAIAPEAQGNGHGRTLIAFAEDAARAAGSATIRLYTNEVMTRNIALYTRLGFVETHRGEGDRVSARVHDEATRGRQGHVEGSSSVFHSFGSSRPASIAMIADLRTGSRLRMASRMMLSTMSS